MKKAKSLILFSFIACSIILGASILGYSQQYVQVIAIKANLRATPESQGRIVAELKIGDKLQLIKQSGAWFLVQSTNNVGWLHGNTINLIKDDEEEAKSSGEVKINTSYWSEDEDNGYDIVRIQKPASLYLRPNGSIIKSLSLGATLVLLSRGHTEGWLNIIDVSSGKEGWIYYKNTQVYLTQKPISSESAIQGRRTENNNPPSITISNDTDRLLTIRVGENVFEIEAYSSKSISLSGGTYKFYASVPRAYPSLGSKQFVNGYIYSWKFYIGR